MTADNDPPSFIEAPAAAPEPSATVSMRGPRTDHDRDLTHPCCRCGTVDRARDLVTIGTYTRPMGGNLLPGDAIDRPMCERCREETEPGAQGSE